MHSLTIIIKKAFICSAVFVLSSFSLLPISQIAAADCDPTPPADSSYGNGIHHPVGADAGMFTYDCSTGMWTSQYYTYNPATSTRTASYSPNYGYDCTANKWYMDEYDYSAGDGAYHRNRVVAPDPGLATNCPVIPSSATGTANTGSNGNAASNGIASTGPGSTNGANNNVSLNGSTNNNNQLSMGNAIYSNATTGNAFVLGNTTGGSASSGDAQSIANIANLLQSTSNSFNGATTFTANINGDVNGDFMFDPAAIMNTGPNSANAANNNLQVNTNNSNDTNAQINNNINVGATSGNATVANNTNGGNATSGNADAVVNLMNLINSTVSSGHSFVGTVNINGNLNGDILLPQNLVDQLLASTGPNSVNSDATNTTDNSKTTNNTTEGVANTITSTAATGNTNVSGNTTAGNAASGNANTGVTLLNLTGSSVVGTNDILVFVNVLGKWVGMIVNAPAGSTAASLGGGIISSGPGSSNTTSNNITDNSTTTNNANLGINNNVNVHAQSGDASVTGNTTGGNAKSGDANTAVNILNLEGSNLNLSNYFGVLFINVFGNWTGSFGVNTSAGDPLAAGTTLATSQTNNSPAPTSGQTFATFVAHNSASSDSGSSTATQTSNAISSVLGTTTSVAKKLTGSTLPTADTTTHASYVLPAIGISIALVMLIGERVVALRKK